MARLQGSSSPAQCRSFDEACRQLPSPGTFLVSRHRLREATSVIVSAAYHCLVTGLLTEDELRILGFHTEIRHRIVEIGSFGCQSSVERPIRMERNRYLGLANLSVAEKLEAALGIDADPMTLVARVFPTRDPERLKAQLLDCFREQFGAYPVLNTPDAMKA